MNIHIKSVFENVIVDDKEPQTLTRWQDPTIKEYKKEIDRLNNIINKLEKNVDEALKSKDGERYKGYYMAYSNVKHKLNELKGDK